MFMASPRAPAWRVTVSGETGIIGTDTSSPFDARAGVRVRTNGQIETATYNGSSWTYTPIDTGTDWIIPNSAANSSFEVLCTDNNANLDAGSDTEGSWIAVSADRLWYVRETVEFQQDLLDIDISIRFNGGTTLDTGNFTGNANANL